MAVTREQQMQKQQRLDEDNWPSLTLQALLHTYRTQSLYVPPARGTSQSLTDASTDVTDRQR